MHGALIWGSPSGLITLADLWLPLARPTDFASLRNQDGLGYQVITVP
jgi:hypothetical protein